MTRRITYYVVFVTLILGQGHTEDEVKVRDMFKSDMTRNDFLKLLQSLINLNEQRVGVLQKLYRLEDYGVLSEVLRSSDKKTGNGNPNNLFLIVMSKNQNDPSRRKVGSQVVDSITSLDAGNNNIHPKLNFVLDPAAYISQNIRKENRLESIFGNIPRVPTQLLRADDKIKKITTTTKTLKYKKLGLRAGVKHEPKTTLKANEDRKHHKENSRYKIVRHKGRHPNASEKLPTDDDKSKKYPQTVGYNSQSNEYREIDFPIENDELTIKPIIIKHILSSNHKKSKHPIEGKGEQGEDDYDSPFNHTKSDRIRQYTKMISDISVKKHHDYDQYNSKANIYTPKIKVQSKQQNGKLTTKPIIIKHIMYSNYTNSKYPIEGKGQQHEDDYGSLFSNINNDGNRQYTKMIGDISIKKHYSNDQHNPKTNKYIPTVKVYSKQQNGKLTTKPVIIKDISDNHQNPKYPLEDKDEQDEDFYGYPFSNIENNHNSQYTNIDTDVSIKNLHFNNLHNSKKNVHIPKVKKGQRNQQNDELTTKRITIKDMLSSNRQITKYPLEDKVEQDEDYYGSPFSNIENDHNSQYTNINTDISIKKLHVNNRHNPKINDNTPNIEFQSNQYLKFNENKSNLNKTAIETNTRKNKYRIIYGTVNSATASENNHSITNPNLNNDKLNVNNHDLIHTKIKHKDVEKIDNNKFLTLASENVYGTKSAFPETTKDTQYGIYLGFEDHKDLRDNSNKNKPNTAKELPYDNLNKVPKKDTDYYGVKITDNGKKSGEEFSVLITNVGTGTAEEVKQQNDPKLILNEFNQPESKNIGRKPFTKCLNKKAFKLCSKSCISAYKNVCQRIKCTSRSKKALKKECKRSCKKTFRSSSSKYSNENSDTSSDENSDESYSNDSS